MEDLAKSIEIARQAVLVDQARLSDLRAAFAESEDLDVLDRLNREIAEQIQWLRKSTDRLLELRSMLRSVVETVLLKALGEEASILMLAAYLARGRDKSESYIRLYRALRLLASEMNVIDAATETRVQDLTSVYVYQAPEEYQDTRHDLLAEDSLIEQTQSHVSETIEPERIYVADQTVEMVHSPEQTSIESQTTEILRGDLRSFTDDAIQVIPTSRSIEPVKRGGRPRGQRAIPDLHAQDANSLEDIPGGKDRPRVRIEARRMGIEWDVVVIVKAEHGLSSENIEIFQDDACLRLDASDESVWHLNSLSDFEIAVDGGESITFRIPWIQNDVLAFRICDETTARAVTRLGDFKYAMLVPRSWNTTLYEYMEPHGCSFDEYKFVFLDLSDAPESLEFKWTGGTTTLFLNSRPNFRCDGVHITDADPDVPALFGPGVPVLCADKPEDWKCIAQIVLVEDGETSGRARRRASFRPMYDRANQVMPPLANWKAGWFTARLYDEYSNLVDTVSFRYVAGFSVTIRSTSTLPKFGLQPQLRYRMNWPYWNKLDVVCRRIPDKALQTTLLGVIATLDNADATFDVTEWKIHVDAEVDVELTLKIRADRTWWTFAPSGIQPNVWSCQKLDLNRVHFRAGAGQSLWIKSVPGRNMQIGFAHEHARNIVCDESTGIAELPLRGLGTEAVIAMDHDEAELLLWCGEELILIASIAADSTDMNVLPLALSGDLQIGDADARVADLGRRDSIPRLESRSDLQQIVTQRHKPKQVYRDPDDAHFEQVISSKLVDYSDLITYADDRAYRWYAISCSVNYEAKNVSILRMRLKAQGLEKDVPVILFPEKNITYKDGITSVKRSRRVPAISDGYFFVLRKPEVDIRRYLTEIKAKELDDEISVEWLNSIVQFKREEQSQASTSIAIGTKVILTDGPMKGTIGDVLEINSARRTVKIGIALIDRVIPTEVDLALIALA